MGPIYASRWLLLLLALLAVLSGCGSPEPATVSPEPDTPPAPTAAATAVTAIPPQAQMTRVTSRPSVEVALEHIQVVEGKPLATVNGEAIYWEDYAPSLYQALNKVSREGNVDWTDPAMQQRLGQLQNDVLEQTAERWALRQLAEEMGLVIKHEAVDTELEDQKADVAKSTTYTSWDDYLQRNGFTDQSLRQVISDTLMLVAMIEAQEVETSEEQIHLAHITVADADAAQQVLDRLGQGDDFADLAAEYSLDEGTRANGGDLGWSSPTELMPELLQAIGPLSVGQYTQPIPNRMGFTIVQLLGREVRDADPQVIRQWKQEKLMAWFESKKPDIAIELLVDFTQ